MLGNLKLEGKRKNSFREPQGVICMSGFSGYRVAHGHNVKVWSKSLCSIQYAAELFVCNAPSLFHLKRKICEF